MNTSLSPTQDQAQAILAHWLTTTLRELLPADVCTSELLAQVEDLADTKAQALAQGHPELLSQLTEDDLDRICDSLRYHYELTPNQEEDERNQAVIRKIHQLT